MNELARHLTEAAGHGHLPFHPACPACREERLAGTVPARPVVSPRTQAGLAAAVLATSAAAPAAAIAQSPPASEAESGVDDAVEPDAALDPGAASGADAPLGDEDALDTAPADGQADAGAPEPDVVEEGVLEGPAAPEAEAPAEAQAPPPAAGAPARAPAAAKPRQAKPRKPAREPTAEHRSAAPASPTAPGSPLTPAAEVPAAVPAQPPGPTEGARHHVVQPGESLWSIAHDLLGAEASNAEIAREVERIWDLNAEAIGTGDPNLVMTGQKLRLR